MEDEVIAKQLEALLTPAIRNQENYYRKLGLRERILNLPLMMAAVLTLLWRDVAGGAKTDKNVNNLMVFCGANPQKLVNKLYHKGF